MKRTLLFLSFSFLFTAALAQSYNDTDFGNDGGLLSDWQSQWINLSNGVYTGTSNGVFEHRGPAPGTLTNNGTFNALSGHTDRFLGPQGAAGVQEIAGSQRPFFYHLELNNGAGAPFHITNQDGANVRASATFSNGITTTLRSLHQAGALRFENGATYTGGNTDAQHVDGYVSKLGATAFTFPTGSGADLRTLSIGTPTVPSEISVAWFAGNPGSTVDPSDGAAHSTTAVAAPLVSVSTAGFWDYVLVSGSDDGLPVTVSLADVSGFALANDLRLAGWNGSQWIDLSGSATATGNTENSTLSGVIPAGATITALAVASTSTALPVHFAAFTLSAAGCAVRLDWSTAAELNNDHFVVERSTDGAQFTALAQVPAAGNSHLLHTYQYLDQSPQPGYNHYRVRQVDLDGRSQATTVRTIRMSCAHQAGIDVYPTVTRNAVTVSLNESFRNARVELFDIAGRKMPVQLHAGALKVTIPVTALAAGQYIVRVVKNGEVQTFQIVKP